MLILSVHNQTEKDKTFWKLWDCNQEDWIMVVEISKKKQPKKQNNHLKIQKLGVSGPGTKIAKI